MRNTKLHQLLSLFTPEDWRAFPKFIHSGFFNPSEKLRNLADFLHQKKKKVCDHPEYFTEARLYSRLEGGRMRKQLSEKEEESLRRQKSELVGQIKSFFQQLSFRDDLFLSRLALLRAWRQRNDQPRFLKTAQSYLRDIEAKDIRNEWDHALSFITNEELVLYHYEPEAKKSSGGVQPLFSLLADSEKWFLLVQLRAFCELIGREKIYNEDNLNGRTPMLEWLLKRSEIYCKQEPLIHLYRMIALIHLRRSVDPHLETARSLFRLCAPHITPEEGNALVRMLANYAIYKTHNGHDSYRRLILEIYKMGDQFDCLILRDSIEPSLLINIAVDAAVNKDFDFGYYLIEKYKGYLPEDEKTITEKLCLAYLHFHAGQYQKTFDLLANQEAGNIHFQLRIRGLMLRSLYYLIDQDANLEAIFDAKAQNFQTYLSRNGIVDGNKKQMYRNFTRRMMDLVHMRYHLSQPVNAGDKASFLEKLEEKPPALRAWLIEQLNQL